jgi:hypothetical protein
MQAKRLMDAGLSLTPEQAADPAFEIQSLINQARKSSTAADGA